MTIVIKEGSSVEIFHLSERESWNIHKNNRDKSIVDFRNISSGSSNYSVYRLTSEKEAESVIDSIAKAFEENRKFIKITLSRPGAVEITNLS